MDIRALCFARGRPTLLVGGGASTEPPSALNALSPGLDEQFCAPTAKAKQLRYAATVASGVNPPEDCQRPHSALEIAQAFAVSSQVIAGILGAAERRLARLSRLRTGSRGTVSVWCSGRQDSATQP
jgi:hypothetical protein